MTMLATHKSRIYSRPRNCDNTGAISGAINHNENIFQGIHRTFENSALNVLTLGGQGATGYSQALYLQKVQDFSTKIQETGLAQAIEDYATTILHENTISLILKTFDDVYSFVQTQLDTNNLEDVVMGGQNFKKLNVSEEDYLLLTENLDFLQEIKRGDAILNGEFAVDEFEKFGLQTGSVRDYADSFNLYEQFQLIENGQQTYAEVTDINGNTILVIEPTQEGNYNIYDSFGEYLDAVLNVPSDSYNITVKDGVISNYNYDFDLNLDITSNSFNLKDYITSGVTEDLTGTYVSDSYFDNISPDELVTFEDPNGETKYAHVQFDETTGDLEILTNYDSNIALLSQDAQAALAIRTAATVMGVDPTLLSLASSLDFSDVNNLITQLDIQDNPVAQAGIIEFLNQITNIEIPKVQTSVVAAGSLQQSLRVAVLQNGQIALQQNEVVSATTTVTQKLSKVKPLGAINKFILPVAIGLEFFDIYSKVNTPGLTLGQQKLVVGMELVEFVGVLGMGAVGAGLGGAAFTLGGIVTGPGGFISGAAGSIAVGTAAAMYAQRKLDEFKGEIYQNAGIDFDA